MNDSYALLFGAKKYAQSSRFGRADASKLVAFEYLKRASTVFCSRAIG